ncbi:hypothetical protein KC19_9G040000 [Ceratodon purpureus]|uniref:Transcription factor TFIIIC triple barrel domain-containing protein n=1 Tax=Ceratodon purpureus TaxID=3225 RepID=A0A8T0GQD5_CERPU|nr:hypothetical protein KC19_9G040000 [Ceratodon purpureus]
MSFPRDVDYRYEGRIRDRDAGITRNIDHFMEELRREQEAIDKRTAEYEKRRNELRSQIDQTGNGAMSLDDTEVAEENDEEDWEEEYVVLDLDNVFHGAPIPNFAYTLSGLDTLNPILTLDNGLKLIGQYTETIGSVVVYSEKEKDVSEAQADTRQFSTPADPFAVHTVKKPLKRIRGVCKLERKLKFCAMPAPPNIGMFMQSTIVQTAMPAGGASRTNARPVESSIFQKTARPVEDSIFYGPTRLVPVEDSIFQEPAPTGNASLGSNTPSENARPVEDSILEEPAPTGNASLGSNIPSENARPVEDSIFEEPAPTENASLGSNIPSENARPVEDSIFEEPAPTENASLGSNIPSENARPVEDSILEEPAPTGNASLGNNTPSENARPGEDSIFESSIGSVDQST